MFIINLSWFFFSSPLVHMSAQRLHALNCFLLHFYLFLLPTSTLHCSCWSSPPIFLQLPHLHLNPSPVCPPPPTPPVVHSWQYLLGATPLPRGWTHISICVGTSSPPPLSRGSVLMAIPAEALDCMSLMTAAAAVTTATCAWWLRRLL